MKECCENCKFYHRLKHNFKRGEGFQKSHCCDVLVHEDGWIQEVEPEGMCEMFSERNE